MSDDLDLLALVSQKIKGLRELLNKALIDFARERDLNAEMREALASLDERFALARVQDQDAHASAMAALQRGSDGLSRTLTELGLRVDALGRVRMKDGADGRDGVDGKDGERGPMPDHEWKGTSLRFQKPDGTWGKFVDLRGPTGARGLSGGGGGVGIVDNIEDATVSPSTTWSSEKIAEELQQAGGIERSLRADPDRPLAYVGYLNRIVRMDYSSWPPVKMTATTSDLDADWPNRDQLNYVA